jgi:hypothetical protein
MKIIFSISIKPNFEKTKAMHLVGILILSVEENYIKIGTYRMHKN